MIGAKFEAEKALLGSILLDPAVITQLKIVPDNLTEGFHRSCYRVMQQLNQAGEVIDVVSLYNRMNSPDGLIQLTELAGSVPTAKHILHYEKIILERCQEEKMMHYAQKYVSSADTRDFEELVAQAQHVQGFAIDEQRNVQDDLIDIFDSLYTEQDEYEGAIQFGFKELDKLTGGAKKGDFIIIGARPSVGKTAFALNLALLMAKKEILTDVFSIEMTRKSLLRRLISAEGNLPTHAWYNPTQMFSNKQKEIAGMSVGTISDKPIFINEMNPLTTEDVERQIIQTKKIHGENKRHVAIIDYLGLMETKKQFMNETLKIADITKSLKRLAKKHNMPIILLSQLSRTLMSRQDKRPMLSDLRDSGAIEQDADMIIFLHREDYYDREAESDGTMDVIVAKNREGATGDIKLAFIKEYSKFVNLEMRCE
ncbi:replicative DNA helicase [Listeria fleischmannii]|uniref:DNA 5'-3' helicase n=1 Tax=Listeria fleischmannii FSL S10-1203 TaxID=1265822 RepID=W7DNA4_9LIST|nr:replicative DNA helicase [Listeria fleischmannii]EUJ56438.1 replicative DNA helicase [Listeria fleischmannii FSL S10-1203]